MTPIEEQTRGHRAAEILENELFKDAFEAIERELFDAWVNAPARDDVGKAELWRLVKTARKFRGIFEGYVATGKLATERLAQIERESLMQRAARKLRAL